MTSVDSNFCCGSLHGSDSFSHPHASTWARPHSVWTSWMDGL